MTSRKLRNTHPRIVLAQQSFNDTPILDGQDQQESQTRKQRGHLRGTRSNGFASGPPFPAKHPVDQKRSEQRNVGNTQGNDDDEDYDTEYYPWGGTPLNERQKQQQMALIEHVRI